MIRHSRAFPLISLLMVIISFTVIIFADRIDDVVFQFPEYDYKDTSKNVCAHLKCLLINFDE